MSFRTLVKKFIPRSLFGRIEPLGHLAEAFLFNLLYGFPARKMKIIGVTGTNGKTTTSFMVHKMLRQAGYNAGLNTTVSYGVNDDIRPQLHHMTNVTVPELMKRLKWMKKQGVEWLVLETTSHALAQNRVWGLPYSVAVITNITHEHLAFHGTFERYLHAKRKLFVLANKNKKGLRTGIVNLDDPNAAVFESAIKHSVTYGIGNGEVSAQNVRLTPKGCKFDVAVAGQKTYSISCNLPGSFNVSNALAAVAVGRIIGLNKQQIEQGILALQGIEGRMTSINQGQDFEVIVDYAHTPDSFEKLFADVRPLVKGNIIALFGSLGGGDLAKRPLQGQIAGKYADIVVLCQEDDRHEDPQKILNEIAAGAEKSGKVQGKDLFLVHDRTQAIKFALGKAQKGDMVLLLGKGHEKTQEDATGEHPWDEIATTKQLLTKPLG